MKRRQSRLIMGSAIGLAVIAVAIDHTRHPLPEPAALQQVAGEEGYSEEESPCGLELESPCSLDESPCGLE